MASEMMRRILVDHARRRKMAKRSGGWARVALDEAVAQRDPRDVDLLDLDAALSELASFDPRKSRVVELRFFGGLSLDDSAQALGISRATVERDWQVARNWLYRRLNARPRSPMTPERWSDVERVYHAALSHDAPAARARSSPRRARATKRCDARSNRCSPPSRPQPDS